MTAGSSPSWLVFAITSGSSRWSSVIVPSAYIAGQVADERELFDAEHAAAERAPRSSPPWNCTFAPTPGKIAGMHLAEHRHLRRHGLGQLRLDAGRQVAGRPHVPAAKVDPPVGEAAEDSRLDCSG